MICKFEGKKPSCTSCIYFIRNQCRGVPIKGFATNDSTKNFLENKKIDKSNIRAMEDLYISSLGFGSNKPTFPRFKEEYKGMFRNSIEKYILCGGNMFDVGLDTAYMGGWSEFILGNVIFEMTCSNILKREEIVIISKFPSLSENFQFSFEQSLRNLNLENIDIYLVHDHEKIFTHFNYEESKKITEKMIIFLEEKRKSGKIRFYGISIGDYYLVSKKRLYGNLEEIYSISEKLFGKDNGFKIIELPLNPIRPEGLLIKDQEFENKLLSLMEISAELGLNIILTETLSRGSPLNHSLFDKIPGNNIFQKQLILMKSLNHVKSVLFGSINLQHIENNMKILKMPNLDSNMAKNIFFEISQDLKDEWWINKIKDE